MSLTVDELKSQLRIDGTQDDGFIQELLTESQDYVMSAVDSTKTATDYDQFPLFDRAVALLVGHWYFNRQESYTANRQLPLSIPYGVEEIVNTLRGKMTGGTA